MCVAVCFALTHLELKLSGLRNVDINQSHREWCVLEFLHGIIKHKHALSHKRTYTHTRLAHIYVLSNVNMNYNSN